MTDSPLSYNPGEFFAFVSYARDDSDAIYREISLLQSRGLNVWYDRGITSGSSYLADIANALEGCGLFILFVTPKSISSKFVRKEIVMADEMGKPFLLIFLEPTEIPTDLKLIFGDQQHIDKYSESREWYVKEVQNAFIAAASAKGFAQPIFEPKLSEKPESGNLFLKRAFIIALAVVGLAMIFLGICMWQRMQKSSVPEDMVFIESGEYIRGFEESHIQALAEKFNLGASSVDLLRSHPRKASELPAFYISRYAVTNAQYHEFVKATGYPAPSHWLKGDVPFDSRLEEHPVVNINFKDASAYCFWRGARLPTAQEWEKAARGTEGQRYPWGDKFMESRCNTAEAEQNGTAKVSAYEEGKSPYGLYNMAGNVYQWTRSGEGKERVIRGGSWRTSCEVYGLAAFSRSAEIDFTRDDLGCRCAMNADE